MSQMLHNDCIVSLFLQSLQNKENPNESPDRYTR